jgi:hypothetical protein
MKVCSSIMAILLAPALLAAQHPGGGAPTRSVPAEAKQFDFLLGHWELVVKPAATSLGQRIHGVPKMLGTWKAWRALDGWGITDELRITDESGNPRSLSHAVRMYDPTARRWTISMADVYRSTFAASTAEWKDNRMQTASKGTDAEGKPYVARARYSDITPTSFRFQQERSVDDGKTWTLTLTIDAKRVAAVAPR